MCSASQVLGPLPSLVSLTSAFWCLWGVGEIYALRGQRKLPQPSLCSLCFTLGSVGLNQNVTSCPSHSVTPPAVSLHCLSTQLTLCPHWDWVPPKVINALDFPLWPQGHLTGLGTGGTFPNTCCITGPCLHREKHFLRASVE